MDQHKFIERNVEVLFDSEWKVIKLDEHRYYKRVSGRGMSGIDFMAVHPIFGLALIELKNYTKGLDSIPLGLDEVMLAKKRDAIRLIHIVNKYYQRQLYFRILNFIGWKYLIPREWEIWIQANHHLQRGNFFFLGAIDY